MIKGGIGKINGRSKLSKKRSNKSKIQESRPDPKNYAAYMEPRQTKTISR
jgi:hypothetical protein